MPIPRDIFPLIYLTCASNVKCWSTITTKNFVWLVRLMTTLSIIKSLFKAIWPPFLRNSMKCVCFRFNESLLGFSQSTTLIISSFMICTRSSGFLPDTNIFESSAKKSENRILDTLAGSLMYNKNSNGPDMEPWGTPHQLTRGITIVIYHILFPVRKITFKPLQRDVADTQIFQFSE